jgi:hypothetical protein
MLMLDGSFKVNGENRLHYRLYFTICWIGVQEAMSMAMALKEYIQGVRSWVLDDRAFCRVENRL